MKTDKEVFEEKMKESFINFYNPNTKDFTDIDDSGQDDDIDISWKYE